MPPMRKKRGLRTEASSPSPLPAPCGMLVSASGEEKGERRKPPPLALDGLGFRLGLGMLPVAMEI